MEINVKEIILYHYTPIELLDYIYASKLIKASRYITRNLAEGSAVSLTDDKDPGGHGLTEGLAFEGVLPPNTRANLVGGKHMSVDARTCRITLKLEANSNKLVKADHYYKKNITILRTLEARACFPHNPKPSEELLAKAIRDLISGQVKGKGHTWWYYRADIPYSHVVDVERMDSSGQYQSIFDDYR